MGNLIKKVKIKQQDGTYTDYIPIGADAKNVVAADGDSVELKLNKKPYYYNTVADMKADMKLKAGDMAITLGYHEVNDGGNGEYNIVKTSSKYVEELNNQLKAELIIKSNTINAKQFGAYGDKTHDDIEVLRKCVDYCLTNKTSLYLDGIFYISDTLNCHGIRMVGERQPTEAGVNYPGNVGYHYPQNRDNGANITFPQYIKTIVDGTAIVSDVANPILSSDYNEPFDLHNFGVYGWLRNDEQEGVVTNQIPKSSLDNYYPGAHQIENFSVFNTGSNGMHLHGIECTTVKHLIIRLVNGYGLLIDGIEGQDCPCDYTTFEDCQFSHTRLSGIALINTYRQMGTFRHCMFQFIGQYAFGVCNDKWGERILPTNDDDIIYAININGHNTAPYAIEQSRQLLFDNVYGEQTSGFVKVENITTLIGFEVKKCSIIQKSGSIVSCGLNFINVNYIFDLKLDYSINNVSTQYKFDDKTISINFADKLPNRFITDVKNVKQKITRNYQGTESFETAYLENLYAKDIIYNPHLIKCNDVSESEQEIQIDIKEHLEDHLGSYSLTNGQGYALAILSLSAGTSNMGDPALVDLIAITQHSHLWLITFLTKNIESASADNKGIITVTVPQGRIANIQFINKVDNTY